MSRKMPALYNQILDQQNFVKTYDTQLEVDTRVKRKMAEIAALQAKGLSLTEMQIGPGSNEAKETLEFLKEHNRKIKEKSDLKRLISKNE